MGKKNPCALLINDIHVSKDNVPEFQLNWNEALDVCNRHGIQEIIVGGDMWLSRSSQTLSTIMAVRQAILKATKQNIFVVIAEGNHDLVDQEAMEGYNHVFSDYQDVEVIDDYAIYDISDGVTLYVMSYFPEKGSFTERYEAMLKDGFDDTKKNILYIHEGINGGLAVPSDDELPASMFKPFDAVLVGHYHNRKKIDGTKIEYIGASRQHNFGEDEEKGYTILYEDGSWEFIKNQVNTRYKVIDIDIADVTEDFVKELQRMKQDGRYKIKVRIACKSKEAQTIDKQRLVDNGANKIELVTEQTQVHITEGQSISKKFDKNGIKQEYSDFCESRNIANVELGLQYLDKIKAYVATE